MPDICHSVVQWQLFKLKVSHNIQTCRDTFNNLLIKKMVSLGVHQASSMPNNIERVEDRKMTCRQGRLDYDWIYSLKILAHFRSKVLVDFHHSVTQINCLTDAIISETYIWHILRMNIFNDYTILHTKLICGSLMFGPLMLRPVDLWREHPVNNGVLLVLRFWVL
jgi:hypothetical protein